MNQPTNQVQSPQSQGSSLKWLLIVLIVVVLIAVGVWVFYIK